MFVRLGFVAAVLCLGGVAGAEPCSPQGPLSPTLHAVSLRSESVAGLLPGTGTEVQLAPGPCGGLNVRAPDGATAADLTWARHVADANRLAEAFGAAPLEVSLITQNFADQVGVLSEHASVLAGPSPDMVLGRFFMSRLKDSSTLLLDVLDVLDDAPDSWSELVTHLRAETDTPILIAPGSQREVALPDGLIAQPGLSLVTDSSGIEGIVVDRSDGSTEITIAVTETVAPGAHRVYFYSGDSRFEPVGVLDVKVIEPKQTD